MDFKNAYSLIVGLIFLFSSIAKAIDIETFAFLLMSYGNNNFSFFAPIITAIEFYLGLSFLFGWYSKELIWFSFLLVFIFTLIFVLGYYLLEIEDCGCFGNLLKLDPIVSIVKNAVLLIILFLLKENTREKRNSYFKLAIIISFTFIVLIINGFEISKLNKFNRILVGHKLEFFKEHIQNDSQIWFIFSPNCAHCQKMIPQINALKNDVIGVYSTNIKREKIIAFSNKYNLKFKLVAVDEVVLNKLTHRYPLIIFSENGIVNSIKTDL
jgi:thiol-disulfide isomerase/thioredoxin